MSKKSKKIKKIEPKKKYTFSYRTVNCAVCNKELKMINDFNETDYQPEEVDDALKAYKETVAKMPKITYEGYIVKHKTVPMSIMQAGYLCSSCLKKDVKDRIKIL